MWQNGFNKVMGGTCISLVRPEELELLVCGTPHLNFHDLEENTK
jgi:ubiquitin-protein ligase E3 A